MTTATTNQTTPAPIPLRLSVALCTCNGADFLPEQLASYVAQTRRPDELVVCDDASTDATRSVLEAFAAQAVEGAIVNLLDQKVLKPDPRFFSYSLSRNGLWWATQTLAQALAPGIRVNGVGPGPTLPSIHQTPEEFAAEVRLRAGLGR